MRNAFRSLTLRDILFLVVLVWISAEVHRLATAVEDLDTNGSGISSAISELERPIGDISQAIGLHE